MNNKTKLSLTFLAVLSLMLLPMAIAQPTGGNVTVVGSSEKGAGSVSETVGIEGGNVTNVNISGSSITGRWAGFYGNVSGGVKLTDSSSNSFYEWSVTDMTGAVVYATNTTVADWTGGNIAPATYDQMPSFIIGSTTDNYNSTFTASEVFTSSSLTENDVNYTSTWQNGAQGTLRTYSLYSAADNALIFAGKAQDNVNSFKAGEQLDYQVLVPASSTITNYNFYLELP